MMLEECTYFPSWWPRIYRHIASLLGIDPRRDEEATILASRRLTSYGKDFQENLSLARKLVFGKDVAVIGAHESFLCNDVKEDVIIAADGALNGLVMYKNIIPDIVVTDFDGALRSLLARYKPLVFAHVHGDNLEVYINSVPDIVDVIIPTTQTFPYSPFYNFGGFTDGDRAVSTALALGAKRVHLYGFQRDSVGAFSGRTNPRKKMIKLEIAFNIIDALREIYGSEVIVLEG